MLWIISKRSILMRMDVYLCFLDYLDAFTKTTSRKIEFISEKNVFETSRRYNEWYLLPNVQRKNSINAEKIGWRLRQGDIFSADLFNLYLRGDSGTIISTIISYRCTGKFFLFTCSCSVWFFSFHRAERDNQRDLFWWRGNYPEDRNDAAEWHPRRILPTIYRSLAEKDGKVL